MKKGFGAVSIIVGVVAFVLILVLVFFAVRPTTTGQVVSENENLRKNFLGELFELRAWVVSAEGIKLDVKNNAEENYVVESLSVDGCGSTSTGSEVKAGESRIYTVECSLTENVEFDGKIVLVYSAVDGSEKLVVEGNVNDMV
jgi:hypothetical protein